MTDDQETGHWIISIEVDGHEYKAAGWHKTKTTALNAVSKFMNLKGVTIILIDQSTGETIKP